MRTAHTTGGGSVRRAHKTAIQHLSELCTSVVKRIFISGTTLRARPISHGRQHRTVVHKG